MLETASFTGHRDRTGVSIVALAGLVVMAIVAGSQSRPVFPLAWAGESPLAGVPATPAGERALGAWLMDAREIIEEILVEEEGEVPERGAVILGVVRQGAAARAGLEPADAIVELGGERVVGTGDLWRILASRESGSRLPVTFVRDGELRTSQLEVTSASRLEPWLPAQKRRRLYSAAW